MADNGDDAGEAGRDTGEFVFGDERTTGDESGATAGGGLDPRTVVAAALLVVAVIVLVYVAQLLVTGAMPDLLGGSDGGNAVPNGTTGTSATAETANETNSTRTDGGGDAPDGTTTVAQQTNGSPTSPTAQPTATPTRTATATPETTATRTDTAGTGGGSDGEGTGNETTTPGERSPVIEGFTVADRSGGGAATFDVAWNVTDPDRDLVAVTVTLVADPDGEARIVAQRRFDAGGAQTTGNTTFEVSGGGGEVYEVRIEVTDGSGNTAFSLTREVADGSPDE